MKITDDMAVAFEFTMTDEEGTVLDTSKGKFPYEYMHGYGQVIRGLEQVLEGREEGETFSVTISPEDAYGVRDESLISEFPRDDFEDDELVVGNRVYVLGETGPRMMLIVKFDDQHVYVDTNHELAGKTINYDLNILAVRESTFSERTCGHVHDPIVPTKQS